MRKVGDILKDYLREKGWLTENPYAPLFSEWARVAGEPLAAHTRIRDVREGLLIVDVDHPGWLQIASMRKDQLLRRAREAAPQGRIADVRFVLAQHG